MIGRIDGLFVGKDYLIRGVKIKIAKGFLEQPVKLLYPQDLHCDNMTDDSNETELGRTKGSNTNAKLSPEASI